jgi:hypothetical protein
LNTTEARIQHVLNDLKMPAETFCKLSGISSTRWSRALNGTLPLNGLECQKLSGIAEDLAALSEALSPAPLNFKNLEGISRLLQIRQGGIKLVVAAEPVEGPVEAEAK